MSDEQQPTTTDVLALQTRVKELEAALKKSREEVKSLQAQRGNWNRRKARRLARQMVEQGGVEGS